MNLWLLKSHQCKYQWQLIIKNSNNWSRSNLAIMFKTKSQSSKKKTRWREFSIEKNAKYLFTQFGPTMTYIWRIDISPILSQLVLYKETYKRVIKKNSFNKLPKSNPNFYHFTIAKRLNVFTTQRCFLIVFQLYNLTSKETNR